MLGAKLVDENVKFMQGEGESLTSPREYRILIRKLSYQLVIREYHSK